MDIEQLRKLLEKYDLQGIVPEKFLSLVVKKDDESIIKAVKNMANSLKAADKCRPWFNLFNEMASTDTSIMFIDNHFRYIREKYKLYGLNLPFDNYDEARKFLLKERSEGVLNTPRFELPRMNGMELWQADYNVLKAMHIMLRYEKLKDGYVSIECNRSPFLLELKDSIDFLELYTGFDSPSLLKYFFCGIKPEIERVTGSKTDIVGTVFRIQINTDDVTQGEFESLYDAYKEATQTKYKKRLSEKGKAFALFLQKKNITGMPSAKIFEEWRGEWNTQYPDWPVNDWRSMRKKYLMHLQKDINITPFLKSLLNNKNGGGL